MPSTTPWVQSSALKKKKRQNRKFRIHHISGAVTAEVYTLAGPEVKSCKDLSRTMDEG